MTSADKPAAGMWMIEVKLQSDDDPAKKHSFEFIRGLAVAWDITRIELKAPLLGPFSFMHSAEDPRGIVKFYGKTELSTEEARLALSHFCRMMHFSLQQQLIHVWINGEHLASERSKERRAPEALAERPPGKLH